MPAYACSVDASHAKMKARLEKALAESAQLRVRVMELEAKKSTLEATVKIKETELGVKAREVSYAEKQAIFVAKTEMQEKIEEAFQRGFSCAQRGFESIAQISGRTLGPPNSARMAGYGSMSRVSSGSIRSSSGEDDL